MIKSTKAFLAPVVVLTITAFVLARLLNLPILSAGGIALSVATVTFLASVAWLWKLRPFNGWIVETPVLAGTWQGTVTRQSGGRVGESSQVSMVIQQPSMYVVHCEFRHLENGQDVRSITECSQFFKEPAGAIGFGALFRVEKSPDTARFHDTPTQYNGVVRLVVECDPRGRAIRLRGQYWTNAGTFGALELLKPSERK